MSFPSFTTTKKFYEVVHMSEVGLFKPRKEKLFSSVVVLVLISGLLFSCASFVNGAEKVAEEDILRVRAVKGSRIKTLNPLNLKEGSEYEHDLLLYSNLIRYKPGTTETQLDAAKSLEVSEDGKTISFTLKEGIQFHKGYGEMTAEDVKFSFEERLDSPYSGDWQTLDHVEVTGKYSGKIILTDPMPKLLTSTLPFLSGMIVSKDAYQEKGAKFGTQPIGSGPYYFKDWVPGEKVVFERFEDYYGEKPDFKQIVVYPVSDLKTAELQFDRGDLDDTAISLGSVDKYRKKEDVEINKLKPFRYVWVGFQTCKPPFDDIKVRKAVRAAVSLDEIIQGAFFGVAEKNGCMISSEVLGYWGDCPSYDQDIEKAKKLLEEAGYPDGFETTLYGAPEGPYKRTAVLVKEQLAEIGVKVNIKLKDNNYPVVGQNCPPGMHVDAYNLTPDPGYWTAWFTCDQVGEWNFPHWCSEEYDELNRKAGSTMDKEERGQFYIDMQKIVEEEVPMLFITNGAAVHVTQDNIEPSYVGQYAQCRYYEKSD